MLKFWLVYAIIWGVAFQKTILKPTNGSTWPQHKEIKLERRSL